MINTDKAYIFGLIIGGGSFGSSDKSFVINLPYSKWGDVASNPKRAAKIGSDIMNVISPIITNNYGLSTYYSSCKKDWQIIINGDFTKLKEDLNFYGIDLYKDMRKGADISKLCSSLINDILKRRFIAGLADTIGSTSPSHRRFSDDVQIVSFEFSGFNYNLVFNICKLLASTGCYADQILWNHPNMHASSDPYYNSWKKGFKLRVALDAYTAKMGFAFQSKTISARDNQAKETKINSSIPCSKKEIIPHCSVVHPAEESLDLPSIIRGGHYIHHKQFCAALGCPYAPYKELDDKLARIGQFISPFPIIFKGSKEQADNIVKHDEFLKKRTFTFSSCSVSNLFSNNNPNELLFGDGKESGYPLGKILDGINYIIQKQKGSLKGNRTSGSREEVISFFLKESPSCTIKIGVPDLLSVLLIENESSTTCVMVGAKNPKVYQKLCVADKNNKYKIHIRKISESDY